MTPFLITRNLTKQFKNKVAVNNIDLKIDSGKLVAFLGPNGAGKSTTLKMLIGLIKPTNGNVLLHGLKPNQKQYHHEIGVVFQNSVLDFSLSVKDNLKLRRNMYKKCNYKFINSIIDLLEIKPIMNQIYRKLSGGQKRRVDIARALLNQPKLLFLDEPSTGLDIQTRNKIWKTLNHLRKEYGLTIILTTHYLEEAENADDVYIIDRGEIKAHGNARQLKLKYVNSVLTLWSNSINQLCQAVNSPYKVVNKNQIQLSFSNDLACINLLEKIQPYINHFEYRHGTMADLFIKLTGKKIR